MGRIALLRNPACAGPCEARVGYSGAQEKCRSVWDAPLRGAGTDKVARKLKSDRVLFTATLLLICVSVVMVYSASAVLALERFGQPYLFLTKQALWSVLGLAVLVVAMRVDYRTYKNEAFIWCLLGAVTLMLVAVLFSAPVNGTRRWFGVGGLGIQPSELAKIACVFFTALILERRMHRIDELPYSLLPIGLIVGLIVALILLQPDFGTSVSLALVVAVMIFAAGLHYKYFVGLALAAIPAVYLVLMSASYRRRRLLAFWDPWADPLGDGFQIIQSLVAVGTGGVFGRGLMAGVQKLFYLPEPHTDFIYAVISEELGLIGATAILICFCVIAWRGLRIATRADDTFGSFVALGLTTMIAAQAFINISVVLGLMPTKGIPLPLVSFGGSSLLINLLGMGVLLNISQHESSEA
jgi:cell division protein FtsW